MANWHVGHSIHREAYVQGAAVTGTHAMGQTIVFFARSVGTFMVISMEGQTSDFLRRRFGRFAYGLAHGKPANRSGGSNAAHQEHHKHELAQKAHIYRHGAPERQLHNRQRLLGQASR